KKSRTTTTPTEKASSSAAAGRGVRRCCDLLPARVRVVGAIDEGRVLDRAFRGARPRAPMPRLQPARLRNADAYAHARPAPGRDRANPRNGHAHRIEPGRHG